MNTTYLIIKHMRIRNAHALSSSYTVGFPAMTAFLGFSHALERNIRQNIDYYDTRITGLGIVNHNFHLKSYRGEGNNAKSTIIGFRSPLKKDGSPASFQEIPKADMDISILLEISSDDDIHSAAFLTTVKQYVETMRVAGGHVDSLRAVFFQNDERRALLSLMPGYALISRTDILEKNASGDALGDLIAVLSRHNSFNEQDKDGTGRWVASYNKDGWLIPIGVGFRDLTGPIEVPNQRDYNYEHHFVEPVVSIAEFIMPYRLETPNSMLWRYNVDSTNGMYLCVNCK